MTDTELLDLADRFAENSTCLGIKVGAVITRNGLVTAIGWNRQPYGMDSCENRGHCSEPDHTCLTQDAASLAIHAEIVALGCAAQSGITVKGGTLFVTHRPCFNCLKSAVANGIRKVVWRGEDYELASPIRSWASAVLVLERYPRT